MKATLRSTLSRAVVYGGVSAASRAVFPKRGAVVFYAHRLATDSLGFLLALRPDWFEEQIAHLARHYRFISLDELAAHYATRTPIPKNTAVMTFDDGFKDNLDVGLPILRKYGVPATIFVVTRSAETGELPWPQRLGYVYQHAPAESLGLPASVTYEERRQAFLQVRSEMFPLHREKRDAHIQALADQHGVVLPMDKVLRWDDLREMAQYDVVAGAHTYSHPWLGFIPREEARRELEKCRDDLRDNLGIENAPFCFPAGSCNPGLVELVEEVGFSCSFLPNLPYRVNTLHNADAYSLSRIGLPMAPAVELESYLDGPIYPVRRALNALSRKEAVYSNDERWRRESEAAAQLSPSA